MFLVNRIIVKMCAKNYNREFKFATVFRKKCGLFS